MYRAMGVALSETDQRSAIVAAPMLRPGLAKKPANKRQRTSEVILLDDPAPAMNAANRGMLHRYIGRLPYISLSGAARIGPNAIPSIYKAYGRRETVVERWSS